MAINPGSDLLSDALAAADPRKAQLATQRLTAIAPNGSSTPPSFEATLAEQQGAAQSPANSAANGTASPYAGAPAAQAGPAAQSSAGGAPAGETASPQPQAVPAGNPETPASPARQVAQNKARWGKAASAYREFETTMLKTLFEAMLPQKGQRHLWVRLGGQRLEVDVRRCAGQGVEKFMPTSWASPAISKRKRGTAALLTPVRRAPK